MKKLTTFIVVLLTLSLTGCGSSNSNKVALAAMQEQLTSMQDMREHIITFTLPYYGDEPVTCNVAFSGITVNAIYRIDSGNWTAVEELPFDNVDMRASLSIEGTDVNVFMVQTVTGSHYYFGIRSHH